MKRTLLSALFLCLLLVGSARAVWQEQTRTETSWGWSFVSEFEASPRNGLFTHRLMVKKEGEWRKTACIWESANGLFLVRYIPCEGYGIALFVDPLVRQMGNLILAWRVTPDKAPELVFATPYSVEAGVYHEIEQLRLKDNIVTGTISTTQVDNPDHTGSISFELSAQTPPITFLSPFAT